MSRLYVARVGLRRKVGIAMSRSVVVWLSLTLAVGCGGNGGGGGDAGNDGGSNDTTPPTVVSVTPADKAVDQEISGLKVDVVFSEAIDGSSLENTLTIDVSGGNAVTVISAEPVDDHTAEYSLPTLLYGTTFAATVSGVKDQSGNASSAYNWSFSTKALPFGAPTNLAASFSGATVTVTWDLLSGATYYELCYTPSGGSETCATENTTSVPLTTLTPGLHYDFRVRAYTGDTGQFGPYSSVVGLDYLAAPKYAPTVTAVGNDLTVSFNTAGGGSYNIYCARTSITEQVASQTPGTNGLAVLENVTTSPQALSLPAYTAQYPAFCATRRVSAEGASSVSPSVQLNMIPGVNAPPTINDVKVVSGDGLVTVGWPTFDTTLDYRVYVSNVGTFSTDTADLIATVGDAPWEASFNPTTYFDANGLIYTYVMVAPFWSDGAGSETTVADPASCCKRAWDPTTSLAGQGFKLSGASGGSNNGLSDVLRARLGADTKLYWMSGTSNVVAWDFFTRTQSDVAAFDNAANDFDLDGLGGVYYTSGNTVYKDGSPSDTNLVSGTDAGSSTRGIAVVNGYVWFATNTDIFCVPAVGAVDVTDANGASQLTAGLVSLRRIGNDLYFGSQDGIYKVGNAAGGCGASPVLLLGNRNVASLAVSGTDFFFLERESVSTTLFSRLALQHTTAAEIGANGDAALVDTVQERLWSASKLMILYGNAYWINLNGTPMTVPTSGGTPARIGQLGSVTRYWPLNDGSVFASVAAISFQVPQDYLAPVDQPSGTPVVTAASSASSEATLTITTGATGTHYTVFDVINPVSPKYAGSFPITMSAVTFGGVAAGDHVYRVCIETVAAQGSCGDSNQVTVN